MSSSTMPGWLSWCRSRPVSEAQFQQSFALNVTAVFFLTQGLLQHLAAPHR
nr:hypothetical protein [Mesorhizobium sp.]